MQSKKSCSAIKAISAIFLTFLLASTLATQPAQAQEFKVLHTFHGAPNDGAAPWGVLVRDGAGNFYGTTTSGGSGRGFCTNYGGCGTAFKFNKSGKKIWLHSFTFPKGWSPETGLLRDASGMLYGTTYGGGDTSCDSIGCGTVFGLSATGKETVLYKFKGSPNGMFPTGQLAEDAHGNLYGTTNNGGDYGVGAIFKIDSAGQESVLYSFTCQSDGCYPHSLIPDAVGDLYGVASSGGIAFGNSGYGVVFELDTSGNFTVMHTFGSGADGANPDSALVFDPKGNLYGTTAYGGSGECGGTGCGTVFELSPQSGGIWSESVLYAFCSLSGCADGEEPGFGPLAIDTAGSLYGTTFFGGAGGGCRPSGCGAVFKLDTTGKEIVLHSFTGASDGADPITGVILDRAGNLYGTASAGGDLSCQPKYGGCGTLFRIAP